MTYEEVPMECLRCGRKFRLRDGVIDVRVVTGNWTTDTTKSYVHVTCPELDYQVDLVVGS